MRTACGGAHGAGLRAAGSAPLYMTCLPAGCVEGRSCVRQPPLLSVSSSPVSLPRTSLLFFARPPMAEAPATMAARAGSSNAAAAAAAATPPRMRGGGTMPLTPGPDTARSDSPSPPICANGTSWWGVRGLTNPSVSGAASQQLVAPAQPAQKKIPLARRCVRPSAVLQCSRGASPSLSWLPGRRRSLLGPRSATCCSPTGFTPPT
jgi:hypothetical protein